MKNTQRKEIEFSDIKTQVDSDYIEDAVALHPYDYDGDIMVDKDLNILDGYHRTAGLVRNEIESGDTIASINVIVVTHSATAAILADPNHRLHCKLVGLVANRA